MIVSKRSEVNDLVGELGSLKDLKRAEVSAWFFKTGKGQYGFGDVFLGITVPKMREVAKKYLDLSFEDIQNLLLSKIHEHRFVALAILVAKYQRAKETERRRIYQFYIKNAKSINNWDLVDSSAEYIVGEYLVDSGVVLHRRTPQNDILCKLARSKNLWERRIAIISTFGFIKKNKFEDTFRIAEILLSDSHDLIHKAVGWMLREIGKRDQNAEEAFLKKHYLQMPRTMLRYAIERFELEKRKLFMAKV